MTSSWIHQRWEISRAATRPPTRAGAAAFVLALAIAWSAVFSSASAQTQTGAGVQIFMQIVGTTPDWQEMSLTLSRLEVSGQDANGRRYTVTAFEGSHTVTIPRSAQGLARFVAAGETIPGRIDQVRLTIADAAITVSASDTSTSPRVIPVVFTDDALLVQAPRPLSVAAGETRSLVTPLRLGVDAVLARDGQIAVRPTVAASLLATVRPENFLNGDEILIDGPSEEFPELGITVMRAKALDPTTTSIRDVIVHGGTGALVSLSDLHAQNEAVWRSAHGVLDRELVQRLESLGSTDVVAADLWVDVPGPATFLGTATTASALDVQLTAFLEERRAAAQPILDGLRSTLEAAGATIVGVDSSPAVIRIQATPPVLEQVAHMANILQVSQTRLTTGDVISTDSATDLIQQPLQLAHALGAGRDLRIGIVEPEACIRTTHEAFQFVTFEEAVGGCGASGIAARGGHSTAVAGALAAFIPPSPFPNPGRPETGLAGLFGGRILSHNNCSIPPAMIARNPHLVNFSCTDDQWLDGKDPYMDYAVYTHRIFVANGSGNLVADGPQDLPVYCPSYNSVCVGGYNHRGTVGRGNWGDDIPGGRWRNPLRTGREKPDLIGPTGDQLPSYQGDTRYESRGGTSFSTPFVVGTAGLLMANFPQKLLGNPTLTRATLLASATHSIPGQQPVALINDGVDDKTGAGAPRGDRALQILDDDKFVTAFIDRGRDFDSSGYLTIPLPNFGASPGEKVRVVMTYDHCQVETVSMPERLQADLDLIVYGNGVVRSNNSHVDNTEIVEFTATEQTGISMRVRAQYWDPCFDGSRKTHFAIAWDRLSPEVQ
jgi:Subtilase family